MRISWTGPDGADHNIEPRDLCVAKMSGFLPPPGSFLLIAHVSNQLLSQALATEFRVSETRRGE